MGRRKWMISHFALIHVLFLNKLQFRQTRNEEFYDCLGDFNGEIRDRTAARFCQKWRKSHHVWVFASRSQKESIFGVETFWDERVRSLILVGISMDLPDINRKNLAFNNYFVPFSFIFQFYVFCG